MKTNPLISVIVPVYNGEMHLAEALNSVLAQTYQPIEIIVINDGSVDRSEEVALSFNGKVRYHRQSNQGAGAARNQGIKLAHGSFLAFLDADDLWVPEKLARQIAAFEKDPDLNMVFGHVQQFVSQELLSQKKPQLNKTVEFLPGYIVGTMLISWEAFHRVGYFEVEWELGEFLAWHARAKDLALKSFMLPEVVMKRRLHKTNQGIYKRDHRVAYVRLLKSVLDRRRREGKEKPSEISPTTKHWLG